MIKLNYPENNVSISLLTEAQQDFLAHQNAGDHVGDAECCYGWLDERYSEGFEKNNIGTPLEINHTTPAKIFISWTSNNPSHAVLSFDDAFSGFSERFPNNPMPADILSCECTGNTYTAIITNLFADTVYYWKVVSDDFSEESETRTFITEAGYPRSLFIHGTTNVRDLGGLCTYDGKRIKQGCIYRGSSFENIVDNGDPFTLTERGKNTVANTLKIKNELEIRLNSVGVTSESVVAPKVKFNRIISRGYELFYEDHMAENRGKLIEFFADESNYPIYFHCAIGADRTGTLAIFLLLLLGVKKEQIALDYNITSLTISEKRVSTIDEYYGMFMDGYDGSEPKETVVMRNAAKYLVEKSGISYETIEKLRKNLLE